MGAEEVVVDRMPRLLLSLSTYRQTRFGQTAVQIRHLALRKALADRAVDLKRVACLIVALPPQQIGITASRRAWKPVEWNYAVAADAPHWGFSVQERREQKLAVRRSASARSSCFRHVVQEPSARPIYVCTLEFSQTLAHQITLC